MWPEELHFLQISYAPLEPPRSRSTPSRHRSTKRTPPMNRLEANLSNVAKINQIRWWTRLHVLPKMFKPRIHSQHVSHEPVVVAFATCHRSQVATSTLTGSLIHCFWPAVRPTCWPDPIQLIFYYYLKKNQISKKKKFRKLTATTKRKKKIVLIFSF